MVQAPIKSGAMITARYAIEQNRDLFVCPGNAFDEKYSGCHELIKQGANVFSDMNDFFSDIETGCESVKDQVSEKFKIVEKEESKISGISNIQNDFNPEIPIIAELNGKIEAKIVEELKRGVIDIDEFIRINKFSTDEVNQGITMLEIAGCIQRKGGRLYKL